MANENNRVAKEALRATMGYERRSTGMVPGRVASCGHYRLIPANGSTRCRIDARQISTTSSLRRFASRASLINFSIAQKQIAPTTQIIKTPIKTEIMAVPWAVAGSPHVEVAEHSIEPGQCAATSRIYATPLF